MNSTPEELEEVGRNFHNEFPVSSEIIINAALQLKTYIILLVQAESLLYEFQNNPNIELGEKGQEKIDKYFSMSRGLKK